MFTLLNLVIAILGVLILIGAVVPSLKSDAPLLKKAVESKKVTKQLAIFFVAFQLLIGMFQMRKLLSIGMDDFEMLFYLLAMFSVLVIVVVTAKDVISSFKNNES